MKFFNNFDRFYTTSNTSPFPHRLNGRYEAIISRNAHELTGKRILDIASHDGRWSFAALQAGAAHVTGIEPRQELIDNAIATFTHYGIDSARYEFRRGDVFDLLGEQSFDIVFCLGFFYHTIRHAELLHRIERTGADLVIIDTEVSPLCEELPPTQTGDPRLVFHNPNNIQLLLDPVTDQQMACADALSRNGKTLVGRTSRAAIRFMAEHFGYTCTQYDWTAHFEKHPEQKSSMTDYNERWRETFYLSRQQA